MGLHFFEIVQGFFAVLVLGLIAAALLLVAAVTRAVFLRTKQRMSAAPKPQGPVKLRLVQPEQAPAPENDDDDADWLKDFG
ncbi:MAG: hypothetical protein JOZ72_01285 [Alphaproteobacteria bacterium]|nr:hypothetical protein [Alphaproteobacteria bacterium]